MILTLLVENSSLKELDITKLVAELKKKKYADLTQHLPSQGVYPAWNDKDTMKWLEDLIAGMRLPIHFTSSQPIIENVLVSSVDENTLNSAVYASYSTNEEGEHVVSYQSPPVPDGPPVTPSPFVPKLEELYAFLDTCILGNMDLGVE